MVVQHNISAMNANRYYGINNKALAGSLEKLSSGYAINRAGDNAAGLAVSEKMRAQIGGLTQASKNAEDGISMVQTFEGALQETDSILQRMRTLAVQSANGNYQNEVDRDAIQLEFDQLNDELNQIADTDFNGVVMLNGGVMADGTVANDTSKVADRPKLEDVPTAPDATFTYKSIANATVDGAGNGTMAINGVSLKLTGGEGVATLGTTESGGITKYSTKTADGGSPLTVNNGKASGKVAVEEYYKIDDKTTNIEIHGKNYSIKDNTLIDEDGKDAGKIDGLTYTVNAGKSVKLNGTYDVIENTVLAPATFNGATQAATDGSTSSRDVSGKLDNDANGTVSVGGQNINLEAGNGSKEVSSGTGKITYSASGFAVTSGTNADGDEISKTSGTIEVSGEFSVGEKDATVSLNDAAKLAKTSNAGEALTETNLGKITIDGTDYDITVAKDTDNNYTVKVGDAIVNSGSDFYVQADGTISATKTDSSMKSANITWASDDTSFQISAGAAGNDKEKSFTVGTNAYNVNLNGNKIQSGTGVVDSVKWNDGSYGASALGNNSSITVSGTKATLTDKYQLENMEGNTASEIGNVKISQGVSTSDAYNHGARNLTFADSMTLQVGARGKDAVKFNFSYTTNGIGTLKSDLNASARGLGTDQLSVKSAEEANYAIDQIDNAINKTNMIRATFGSVQNRLEHKINTLDTNNENLTAAESRIRDTQMDKEMMKFTSSQILSQASQSMLAQANSLPQGVLQLLG